MSKEAREQALKFLVSRMRCEREVREHLRKKGHSRADIDDAVDYLYSYEYLDDLKYCEAFIHDRVQFNPCGRQKLFYDLSQKGVSRQTAEEALDTFLPWEEEQALAERLWQKKAQQETDPLKIKRYLNGKGFGPDIISSLGDDDW